MDRNFHTDDFERLLREKSEEFRMYPSKRIWHSIYNNIHPARKWPSVAMSISLITALFLIGYLNTNNTNSHVLSGKSMLQQSAFEQTNAPRFVAQIFMDNPPISSTNETTGAIANNKMLGGYPVSKLKNKQAATYKSLAPANRASTHRSFISDDLGFEKGNATINNRTKKEAINPLVNNNSSKGLNEAFVESDSDSKMAPDKGQDRWLNNLQKSTVNSLVANGLANDFAMNGIAQKILVSIQSGNTAVEKNNVAISRKDFITAEDKDWIENYALYNRPATKRWANKLFWQMYATPSVVYRMLYNDPNFGNMVNATPFAISTSNQDINNMVYHKPSIGMEIGAGIQYLIFKGIKLKAGVQLNYTRYNSDAFQNSHPVATKLTMIDFKTNTSYEEYRTTPYSNKNGLEPLKLHNETFQVSLPLGADLKLLGNENLQWNIGVTIQPTYVVAGKSYLISSDRRNYVKETSMLNRWNLNAGFETFISYQSNGLTFQIGPQFRTQLFSTNSKKFAVEEKLFNYGLKFGISKTLK